MFDLKIQHKGNMSQNHMWELFLTDTTTQVLVSTPECTASAFLLKKKCYVDTEKL